MARSDAHNAYAIGYGLTLVGINNKNMYNINDQDVFKTIKNFNVKIERKKIPLRLRFSR